MIYFISNRIDHKVNYPRCTKEEAIEYLDTLSVIGLDTENTSLNPYKAEMLMVQMGDTHKQFVFDATSIDMSFINDFKDKTFVGQNLKYDASVFMVNGIKINKVWDTMIAEQCLGLGSGRRNSLDIILERKLGIKATHVKDTRLDFIQMSSSSVFEHHHVTYAAEDVEFIIPLKEKQEEFIDRLDMRFWIENIEMPLVLVLAKAEIEGLVFDSEAWLKVVAENETLRDELELKLDGEIENLSKTFESLKLYYLQKYLKKDKAVAPLQIDIFGGSEVLFDKKKEKMAFNHGSDLQVKNLFSDVGLTPPIHKKTKQPTVLLEELEQFLIDNPGSVLQSYLELMIEYKQVKKALESFGKNFLNFINPISGNVHTIYKQCGTVTGRMASGDTKNGYYNSQQIPKDNKYRNCFKTSPGYKMLTIDLSGAEIILLASLANDDKLISLQAQDIHSYLATKAWQEIRGDPNYIVSKKENKNKRDAFKSVVYGIAYGCTAIRIAGILAISIKDAEKVVRVLRREIPKTFEYLDNASKFGLQNGYILLSERTKARRWFTPVLEYVAAKKKGIEMDFPFSLKGGIERECKNSPLQGSNSFIIKEAMVEIDVWITQNNIDANLLLQVHDSMNCRNIY